MTELMQRAGFRTAYQLAKASGGSIPITTAHRLVTSKGRPKRVDLATLDALCDVLGADASELLERDKKPRHR